MATSDRVAAFVARILHIPARTAGRVPGLAPARTPGHAARRVIGAGLFVSSLTFVLSTCQPHVPVSAQERATIVLRGREQALRLFGPRDGTPVIVSSGDGGWMHLAPHVADVLAARGYFVVGFDSRAYLTSFTGTGGDAALRTQDEPGDFAALARYAAGGRRVRPLLIGVSEGAGLSVLAATDPATRAAIGGVVALGLPDVNELAWRWRDAIIYVTKGVPREPTFSTRAIVDRVSPAPLAILASTHDAFMSADATRALLDAAREPKRLWTIEADDHNFSGNLAELDRRLLEAIAWVTSASQSLSPAAPPPVR